MQASVQQQKIRQGIKWMVILGVIALLLVGWWVFKPRQKELISPLKKTDTALISDSGGLSSGQTLTSGNAQRQLEASMSGASKPVIGFLPYWNLSLVEEISPLVTDVVFFRLAVESDGHIAGLSNNGVDADSGVGAWLSDEWPALFNKWREQKPDGRLQVTFFMDNAQDIATLLNDEGNIDRLMMNVHQFLNTYPQVSGVNLDIEYLGSADEKLRDNFTLMMRKMELLLTQYHPQTIISLDIFGKAGFREDSIYDLAQIDPLVEQIILMAYDYKTRSSSAPGPVSPTIGEKEWGSDVFSSLRALTKKVSSQKVIMALPFYGYQWQTTSFDLETARTYPETGLTLTDRKVRELLGAAVDKNITLGWDETSLSPYLFYEEEGKKYVAFYENAQSLGYKLDLIEGMNLGGVAVWAVGYEGAESDLWETIAEKMHKSGNLSYE